MVPQFLTPFVIFERPVVFISYFLDLFYHMIVFFLQIQSLQVYFVGNIEIECPDLTEFENTCFLFGDAVSIVVGVGDHVWSIIVIIIIIIILLFIGCIL